MAYDRKDEMPQRLVALIIIGLVISIVTLLMIGGWFGASFFVAAFGSFMLQSLRKIPSDPPHKGVLVAFGKKTSEILDEGWQYFPLYPWLFSYIPVRVGSINHTLPVQRVRTPDLAEVDITLTLTWSPISARLADYVEAGGENRALEEFSIEVQSRINEWMVSADEGPARWSEALKAHDAIAALLTTTLKTEIAPRLWVNFERVTVDRIAPVGELEGKELIQAVRPPPPKRVSLAEQIERDMKRFFDTIRTKEEAAKKFAQLRDQHKDNPEMLGMIDRFEEHVKMRIMEG